MSGKSTQERDKALKELIALGFTTGEAERWLEKHPDFCPSTAGSWERLELWLYRFWLNSLKRPNESKVN